MDNWLYFEVSFIVEGERLDPLNISKIIGLKPIKQRKKGDLRSDKVKLPTGKWMYSQKGKYGESLNSVVDKLFNKLKLNNEKIDILKKHGNSGLLIFVGYKKNVACYTVVIDSPLLKQFALYNLELNIFTYVA